MLVIILDADAAVTGMLHHVVCLMVTEAAEDCAAFLLRVEE
jgi:hypothetical protein